ncbi:MAG: EAL domain-containing response regulator [Rhodospirillales bacterium]|nr:EAL domain-containing response regulator [Rhodospirillales bacterium]
MTGRLIVVDDDPAFATFVAKVAKSCGFASREIHDAATLPSLIAEWSPTYIVLDLNLPKTDGIEILRSLAEQNCKANILIISGSDDKVIGAARKLGLERGLNIVGIAQKPVRANDLAKILTTDIVSLGTDSRPPLQQAIEAGDIFLVYQPKIDFASGAMIGVEALARWRHRHRGIVMPADFVHLAETTGLIDRLTEAVVDVGMAQQSAWNKQGIDLNMAINLSAKNLHHLDFVENIDAACKRHGVSPGSITFELTESAAMDDATQGLDILTRLRLKGYHLSIDDFGTSYSSLVQLQRLPFSELKIDRSFVAECANSKDAHAIVTTISGLAKNLGLKSVAEGIECEACYLKLIDIGCDIGQGYFIGRPMPASELPRWASAWKKRKCA